MRNANSLGLIALLAACGQEAPEAGNEAVANAPTEIEALPADESTVTTSEELENGVSDPEAANLGTEH
jgi:hypothetical protein